MQEPDLFRRVGVVLLEVACEGFDAHVRLHDAAAAPAVDNTVELVVHEDFPIVVRFDHPVVDGGERVRDPVRVRHIDEALAGVPGIDEVSVALCIVVAEERADAKGAEHLHPQDRHRLHARVAVRYLLRSVHLRPASQEVWNRSCVVSVHMRNHAPCDFAYTVVELFLDG